MRLLLANPNTSQSMAEVMAAEARRAASPGTAIAVCSAEFGSPYISSRSEAAIAGHALISSLAKHFDGHNAIVVGAFIVPAVTAAAKELMPVPLIATGEVGLAVACLLGARFSILSIGAPCRRMTAELVRESGLESRLASIRALDFSGTELTHDQEAADRQAIELARRAIEEDLADVLVLGAGSMEGMTDRIQPHLPVPVVSPMRFAIGIAELMVKNGIEKTKAGTYEQPGAVPMTGIDAALAAMFVDRR